jgi:hypothetical protein
MGRRLLLSAVVVLMVQGGAFRFVNRDALWVDAHAADHPTADAVRVSGDSILKSRHPSRRHLEALIRVTDRDDLRDLRASALVRLAEREPDDAQVQLRLADALRRAGRFDESTRAFERVAGLR